MSQPDLKLMLDNSLMNYEEVKELYNDLKDMSSADNIELDGGSIAEAVSAILAGSVSVSEEVWNSFSNLYEIEGGVANLKKYKSKPYAEIIYNRKQSQPQNNKADIYRYQLCGGDPQVFEALQQESDNVITEIAAGGGLLEDEVVNGIETFFEQFNSKNALLRNKVSDINKWRNIESYEEFLQIPLLKEGKDFMNKFLDIESTIAAGGDVALEDVESLIPDYMLGGTKSLLDAVDPKYSSSSFILDENVSEYSKNLIDRAFMQCMSMIRATTLADFKNILSRINLIVKMIKRYSTNLIDTTIPPKFD